MCLKIVTAQLHIYSFGRREWVASMVLPWRFESCRATITECGIIHLVGIELITPQTQKGTHLALDIGGLVHKRNLFYHALRDQMQMEIPDKSTFSTDISNVVFEFCDDWHIVSYFGRPFDVQTCVASYRHFVWNVLVSFVIDTGCPVSYEHTLSFVKCLFEYCDDCGMMDGMSTVSKS